MKFGFVSESVDSTDAVTTWQVVEKRVALNNAKSNENDQRTEEMSSVLLADLFILWHFEQCFVVGS